MFHKKKLSKLLLAAFITLGGIGISSISAEEITFTDMSKSNSHYQAVHSLVEKGIINGYALDDGRKEFRPNQTITRAQTAQLLVKALDLPVPKDVSNVLRNLTDISEKHYYADAIAATYDAGIFKGSNGAFMDNVPLTREQMATVLVQAFDLIDNQEHVDIKLSNVDPSHRNNVQILANLKITNQLKDFRPKEKVTRGQFATFLYKTIEVKAKQIPVIEEPQEKNNKEKEQEVSNFEKQVGEKNNQNDKNGKSIEELLIEGRYTQHGAYTLFEELYDDNDSIEKQHRKYSNQIGITYQTFLNIVEQVINTSKPVLGQNFLIYLDTKNNMLRVSYK